MKGLDRFGRGGAAAGGRAEERERAGKGEGRKEGRGLARWGS